MNYPEPTKNVKPDKAGNWRVQGRYIATSPEKQLAQRAALVEFIQAGKGTPADLKAYNAVADIVVVEAAERRTEKKKDVERGNCAVDRRAVKRATSKRIWSGWL